MNCHEYYEDDGHCEDRLDIDDLPSHIREALIEEEKAWTEGCNCLRGCSYCLMTE